MTEQLTAGQALRQIAERALAAQRPEQPAEGREEPAPAPSTDSRQLDDGG